MEGKNIKCINCGVYNKEKEFCVKCGAILSYEKRRKLEFEKKEKERKAKDKIESEKNPSFFETYENHTFWIVRLVVKLLKSIWLAFIAIGAFIAWLVAAIAA